MLVLRVERGLNIWKVGWFHGVTVRNLISEQVGLLSQLTSDLAS